MKHLTGLNADRVSLHVRKDTYANTHIGFTNMDRQDLYSTVSVYFRQRGGAVQVYQPCNTNISSRLHIARGP